jgi:hypothetical protein
MISLRALFAVAFGLLSQTAWAEEWPPLPERGFISGRPAQIADVQAGNAVFVAAVDGQVIGRPIAVQIPQYVYAKGPPRTKGVLVQAEEANGIRMYGIKTLSGQDYIATEVEVELLGTHRPH